MNGREQTCLRKARQDGYLDARCKENGALVRAYGLWCWRLKIPMVWLERRTPNSRYARVQLEMFTSANRLTATGQVAMKGICAPANTAVWTEVSAYTACWDHVALANARQVARTVLRSALQPENHERHEVGSDSRQERKTGRILRMA